MQCKFTKNFPFGGRRHQLVAKKLQRASKTAPADPCRQLRDLAHRSYAVLISFLYRQYKNDIRTAYQG